MRPWLIAMLLLTAVLAGCADEPTVTDDGTDTGDGTGGPGDDGAGGSADEPGSGNNTAPVANMTADLVNGTAPLGVNFTLDGSDADGDNLTWILAINGNQTANGTTLPAAFNFTFEAGNHTILLTVSDGNLTGMANLTIAVSETVDEADPNAPQDMGAFWYDPVTGMCNQKSYDGYGSGPATVYNFDFWVFAETNGVPGLQVANNFLVPEAESAGFADPAWEICQDGDQMVF